MQVFSTKEIEALRMRSKQSNTNVEMTPEFQVKITLITEWNND